MRRLLPALALVALLTGCARAGQVPPGEPSAEPEPTASVTPAPVPRFIGAADDGASFTMTVDQTTTLRVTDVEASDPILDGESVIVIPVVNVAPGDGRQWEVRAVAPGTSTIRGVDAGLDWTITLIVSE